MITISVPAGTNGATATATATTSITVTAGNTNDPRLVLTPTTATLPLNPYAGVEEIGPDFVSNYLGSPYIAEITVTWRHSNGQLVAGTSKVNVSIDPTTIAGFSQLDDGTTLQTDPTKPDGNEFLTILGSGPVNVTGGNGVIFVHAGNIPGTAILTVTAIDPDNSQTISSQVKITVAGAATSLPSSIIVSSAGPVYISGSNGPQSTIVSAQVTDGNGVAAADPSGFDNVQFQIVGPATSDARLTGINANGQQVTGTTISTVTHNGVASVTFQSGTQQGPVQVKATADRGDNNVDNGIQDPVSATTTVVVSDGKLFSLTLTAPNINAILINRVSTQATLINQGGGTVAIPPDPNATYSLTVSAIGTDRQGNPVLPGTVVKFGEIDAPQSNDIFSISGAQGNPQEGGTLFTATDGHFRTAGGGAGPGDTLIVFGKDVPGNSDLESAVKVSSINSETSLTVATPFNRNDTTGISVDNGAVLPYIVGRAQAGNISSPASTNSAGVASTTLNYPVSALGRAVAVWAQSNGTDTVTGTTNLVTDAAVLAFPGVAPAKIVISPNPIPGNLTTTVVACIYDALQSPLAGVQFNFSFTNLGVGSGKLDNITGAGVVPDATDASGCVVTTVTTTGIAGSSGGTGGATASPSLTFSAGDASATAPIVASGNLILLARPSSLPGSGGSVTLTLLNGNGTPVPGVQITGTCTGDASIGIASGPGITNALGVTTAFIQANLDTIGKAPGSGSCTFTTSTGSPTATVVLKGVDQCTLGISPAPIGCPAGPTSEVDITINSLSGTTSASISSNPDGLSCSLATPTSTVTCTLNVAGDTYTLTASPGGAWGGNCTPVSGQPTKAKLIVPAASSPSPLTCTLTVP